MAKNFSKLGKEMGIQIHEAQSIPKSLNLNRATPGHIITEMSNVKDLESSKRKDINYIQEISHKTMSRFFNRYFSGQERMD